MNKKKGFCFRIELKQNWGLFCLFVCLFLFFPDLYFVTLRLTCVSFLPVLASYNVFAVNGNYSWLITSNNSILIYVLWSELLWLQKKQSPQDGAIEHHAQNNISVSVCLNFSH